MVRAVKEYCCCAIPLVNAGIYLTLITNFVLGITAGTLALATPSSQLRFVHIRWVYLIAVYSVVGAAVPSFTKWIFAILAYVAGVIQILGLIAVYKVKYIRTFQLSIS